MLKLITYPAAFGRPSASPFCVKAMCLLQMAGAKWEPASGNPGEAPKRKLPVLQDGEKIIADSEDIRAHLEQAFGVDFDKGLSPIQRATSRALIRMVDEHLYFVLVCALWLEEGNWQHARTEFFTHIPEEMRQAVSAETREGVRMAMVAQGMGRHSEAERFDRAEADIDAIAVLLGEKPFLFGEQPTAADASVVPVLEALAKLPTKTKLRQRINMDPLLMAYLVRAEKALYP